MDKSKQEKLYSRMEKSFFLRLWEYAKIIIPLNIGLLLQLSLTLLNLIFAGKYGNDVTIAAIGLSFTFGFLVILGFLNGMAGTLDTLGSQEFGANNFENCAIYFNKTRFSTLFFCILFFPVYYFSGDILSGIGIEQDVADASQTFLRWYYFSNLLTIQAISIRNLFRSQGHVWPHFLSSTITFLAQFLSLYLFAEYTDLGMTGIGISNAISSLVLFLVLYLILRCTGLAHPQTYRSLHCSDLKNWKIFCKVAVPSFLLMIVEGWSFEISTLVIGLLGSVNLAAQGIIANIAGILWISCGFGTSMATAAIVGNAMGMKKVGLAKIVSFEMIIIGLVLIGTYNLTFNFFPRAILGIFTSQEAVIQKAERAFTAMIVGLIFDNLNWVAYGISKGIGVIGHLPIVQFIFYYLIHQPLAILLIFHYHYQFEAYWYICIFTLCCLSIINHSVVWCKNWHKIADEIEERGQKEKSQAPVDPELNEPLLIN